MTRTAIRLLIALLLLAALGVLAGTAWDFALRGARAIASPYGIDYGEGIVWQQALLMVPGTMYGSIDHLPYIVFHYPPLYHLTVRLLTSLTGADMLSVGRAVSVGATLAVALVVGGLTWRNAMPVAGRGGRGIGALVAAMSMFAWWPMMYWAVLMRVDMIASMFSALGLCLGIAALRRPALLYASGLAFVAALMCKQTELITAVAVLVVFARRDSGLALRAFMTAALTLAGLFALMSVLTDGGFLRHILLYNLNRSDWGNLIYQLRGEARQAPLLLLALVGYALLWRRTRWTRALFAPLRTRPTDAATAEHAILGLLPVLMLPTVLTTAKSGASVNYFIPLIIALSPFVGIAAAWAGQRVAVGGRWAIAALVVPVLLMVQPWLAKLPTARVDTPEFVAAQTELLERFRATQGQILADDMVLLLRAGKPVLLEPSIFAELGSTGRWDSRRLLDMIEAHEFALIQTEHGLNNFVTRARYDPEVLTAIRQFYTRVEPIGGGLLLRPSEPPPSPARPGLATPRQ